MSMEKQTQAPGAVPRSVRPSRSGLPQDLYDALAAMGGKANSRELAARIGHIMTGDVATILCAMARKGIIRKLGRDSKAGPGRRPAIFSLI